MVRGDPGRSKGAGRGFLWFMSYVLRALRCWWHQPRPNQLHVPRGAGGERRRADGNVPSVTSSSLRSEGSGAARTHSQSQ